LIYNTLYSAWFCKTFASSLQKGQNEGF